MNMSDRAADQQVEQKPMKRFSSYEEFLKEFYPKSAEHESSKEKSNEDGDFGIELAFDSLNRHANVLRFGE
jgi:hypothetical protein